MEPREIPSSTYRLQISAAFTLADAAAQVDYLADLGVDWLYLSPLLTAEPGSMHGYDVVDPTQVDPARGGRAGLEALAAKAHSRGMRLLVDIVPNHMGIATPQANPFWWSVLQYGQASPYAHWFDIDWAAGADDTEPYRPADGWVAPGAGKVVLAILGAAHDIEQVQIATEGDEPTLRYYEHVLPVAPGSYRPGMSAPELLAVQNYRLVPWQHEDWELNYRRFFSIKTLAGVRVEDPEVFSATHAQIASWCDEGLVDGLRIDHIDGLADPAQYLERLHRLTGAYVVVEKILALGDRGAREVLPRSWHTVGTTGYELIAYIDGALTDPQGFFRLEALREHLYAGGMLAEAGAGQGAGAKAGAGAGAGQFAGEARHLAQHPTVVTGLFNQIELEAKTQFAFGALAGEMMRLARECKAVGWACLDARSRQLIGTDPLLNIDVDALADVFGLLSAHLPVYRLYEPEASDREYFLARLSDDVDAELIPELSPDGHIIARAASAVRAITQDSVAGVRELAYLGVILSSADHPVFVRFTQTTGAVMAKGVEDTSFYRYAALTSLNEVGGEPSRVIAPTALTEEFSRRQQLSTYGLNSLTTHDTKRSEDTRARITALSEVPWAFEELLTTARTVAPVHYQRKSAASVTSRHAFGVNESLENTRTEAPTNSSFDVLLWQAVIGAWPASPERLTDYALKAAREQGRFTTWTKPNEALEDELRAAMHATTDNPELRAALNRLDELIRPAGYSNSMVAKALQLLAPGVPDVYQGTELWDQSLVDPDNRRPVDFQLRQQMLAQISKDSDAGQPTVVSDTNAAAPIDETGSAKLRLVHALLHLRKDHPEVFTPEFPHLTGPPVALRRTGAAWRHVLAHLFGGKIVLLGTRLPIALESGGGWQDTEVLIDPSALAPVTNTHDFDQLLAELDEEPLGTAAEHNPQAAASSGKTRTASGASTSSSGADTACTPDGVSAAELRWRDVLTGQEFTGNTLEIGTVLTDYPVAVLLRIA